MGESEVDQLTGSGLPPSHGFVYLCLSVCFSSSDKQARNVCLSLVCLPELLSTTDCLLVF